MSKHGDGPARSGTGHRFGVRAAMKAGVPADWGRVKEPTDAEIADYNIRQRAKKSAAQELARIERKLPKKIKLLADRLRKKGFSAVEILSDEEFILQSSEAERRLDAVLNARNRR